MLSLLRGLQIVCYYYYYNKIRRLVLTITGCNMEAQLLNTLSAKYQNPRKPLRYLG